jgi:hypothetical protein
VNRALEIVSKIEKLGGRLAVDKDGTIRFRLPKDNPEAKTLPFYASSGECYHGTAGGPCCCSALTAKRPVVTSMAGSGTTFRDGQTG